MCPALIFGRNGPRDGRDLSISFFKKRRGAPVWNLDWRPLQFQEEAFPATCLLFFDYFTATVRIRKVAKLDLLMIRSSASQTLFRANNILSLLNSIPDWRITNTKLQSLESERFMERVRSTPLERESTRSNE